MIAVLSVAGAEQCIISFAAGNVISIGGIKAQKEKNQQAGFPNEAVLISSMYYGSNFSKNWWVKVLL